MKRTLDISGTTLIELLVVMGLFGMIMTAMFSQYVTLLKSATITRKTAKTESDIVNVVWPVFKDIESAGFGVPTTGNCTPAISISTSPSSDVGAILIHSTAAGDKKGSGTWSYVGTGCTVTGIDTDQWTVIIDPATRLRKGYTTVSSSGTLGSSCDTSWEGQIAYWTPSDGSLECYETRFNLKGYDTSGSGAAPAMCAPGTKKVSRSIAYNTNSTSYQPMLDCVLAFQYRFGCIDPSTGNLTWRTDTSCSSTEGNLRLVRVAVVLQESPLTDIAGPSSLTLFEDLASSNTCSTSSCSSCDCSSTVNLANVRYYKWRKIERTIALRNQE